MKRNDAGIHHHHSHGRSLLSVFLRIVESLTVFLLVLALLALSLYLIGNYQSFLDSTQRLLLTLLRASGGICAVAALHYTVLLIVWTISRRHLLLGRMIFGVVATLIGLSLWLSVEGLVVFIGPYP